MSDSPLMDVAGMAFDELLASDDPNLAACIARLMASLDDPDSAITAFQSFASDD